MLRDFHAKHSEPALESCMKRWEESAIEIQRNAGVNGRRSRALPWAVSIRVVPPSLSVPYGIEGSFIF